MSSLTVPDHLVPVDYQNVLAAPNFRIMGSLVKAPRPSTITMPSALIPSSPCCSAGEVINNSRNMPSALIPTSPCCSTGEVLKNSITMPSALIPSSPCCSTGEVINNSMLNYHGQPAVLPEDYNHDNTFYSPCRNPNAGLNLFPSNAGVQYNPSSCFGHLRLKRRGLCSRPALKHVHSPLGPASPAMQGSPGPWNGRTSEGFGISVSDFMMLQQQQQPIPSPEWNVQSSPTLNPSGMQPPLTRIRGHCSSKLSPCRNMGMNMQMNNFPVSGSPSSPVLLPLEEAIMSQDEARVLDLLNRGVNPNHRTFFGEPLLILATRTGNDNIVNLLVSAHADVNCHDDCLYTPLHHAAKEGRRNMVQFLLRNGANMYSRNWNGQLPLNVTTDPQIRDLLTCSMKSLVESRVSSPLGINKMPIQFNGQGPGAFETQSPTMSYAAHPGVLPTNSPNFKQRTTCFIVPNSPAAVTPRPTMSPSQMHEVYYQRNNNGDVGIMQREPEVTSQKLEKNIMDMEIEEIEEIEEQLKSARLHKQKMQGDCAKLEAQRSPSNLIKEVMCLTPSSDLSQIRKDWHEAALSGCVGCGKPGCGGECLSQYKEEGKCDDDGKRHESASTSNFIQWTRGELLGQGSYGKVFAGLNQSTGELMAVKQIQINELSGPQEMEVYSSSLEKEIGLYKKLRHKHIVGYIDMEIDETTGNLYVFLEYVSGGSIQRMLERFGHFSVPVVKVYTRQLLLGLEYLHANQIIHRDIKGGNVLVDTDGIVKLADFGASKNLGLQALSDGALTNCCKSIRGSVFWMAPEVIKGEGYGRRADIWSVGCTVIEMLTASHPWPGMDNTWAAIFHIAQANSGPPLPDDIPDTVRDFLEHCFKVNPKERPTASELLKHPFLQMG